MIGDDNRDIDIGPGKYSDDLKKLTSRIPLIVVVIIVLALFLPWKGAIWYTVDSDEAGVVKTWGRVTNQVDAGLHFKLPYPIQTVAITPLTRVMRFEYGYKTREAGSSGVQSTYEYAQEFMLTQDENILDNEYAIQFQVKDPVRWVLAAEDIASLIYHTGRAAMSRIIGENEIDDALTENKAEVQLEVQSLLQHILDGYDAGILVTGVKFQNPSPPYEVQDAFDNVQSAKEKQQTLINEAEAYQNEVVNAARGEAAEITEQAEAYKYSKIQTAQGEADRFLAVLAEYQLAEDVTRKRLYYEMVEKVLPELQGIYLVTEGDSVVKYLPLEVLGSSGGGR